MATPLVRGTHVEPLQSNEFSEALSRSGYGAIHELLGQPNITGTEALRQLNYGGKISERTLVEMYQGRNLVLANRVELELRNTDSVVFRICPLQKTEHLGKRVMYRTRYKQSVLGPLATYGLVRHMNFQRSSKSFEMTGFGIGFQFELQSLLNEEGRDIFNNYVQMAASNTVLTAEICAIEAIIGCHETDKALDKFFPQTVGSLMDLVSTWNSNAFAIHKKGNGIQQVVGWIKKARVLLKVAAPEALLVPQNTAEQLAFGNPEARDVSRAGQEARDVRAAGAAVYQNVNGLRMIELAPESISDTGAGLYDPLAHVAEFGLFYVADNNSTMGRAPDAPHNTCNERGIAIFSMRNNGNREVVRPETMVQNDLAFDAASGALNKPVLEELARNYETLCRAKQMSVHISPNGDPLVDPNIFFDENGVPQVVEHFGDIDPAYLSEAFIKTLARINQQELERRIGRERMQSIREMLMVLEQSASMGLSSTYEESSVLEAFAAAVALDRRNRVKGRESNRDTKAKVTPGNAYGADYLPPVVAVNGVGNVIATLTDGGIRPIVFNNGLYSVGNDGATNGLILAPAFPPGCSSANWAAYFANGLASSDPGVTSWANSSAESRAKFETVARGWRAFEQLFDEQRSVFSLSKGKNAENVLMDSTSCPLYMKPSTGGNDGLQAKLAYFQQVFVGLRGALAIGYVDYDSQRIENITDDYFRNEYNVMPVHGGAAAAVGAGSRTARNRGGARAGYAIRQRGGVEVTYSKDGLNDDEKLVVREVESLVNAITDDKSTLSEGAKKALTTDNGIEFEELLKNGFNGVDNTSKISDKVPFTVRFFYTPIKMENSDGDQVDIRLINLAVTDRQLTGEIINRVYSALKDSSATKLNGINLAQFAKFAQLSLSSSSSSQSASLLDVQENIEKKTGVPNAKTTKTDRGDGSGSGRFVIIRLQVTQRGPNGLFSSVTAKRAVESSLRPVSLSSFGRILGAPQKDNGRTSEAELEEQSMAVKVSARARAGSYIDRTRGSLTSEELQRESTRAPLGPMSFFIEQNHAGASAGDSDYYGYDGESHMEFVSGKRGGASMSVGGGSAQKRVMGGAGVTAHTYAGINYGGYIAPGEYDLANIAGRPSEQGTGTGDLALYAPVQVQATRWLIARLNILERLVSDPLERAMALTFLLTPVHRDLLMHMVQRNYVLPRSYLLIQPFIRLSVYAAYAVSYNIGQTLYAYPNISIGSDANTLLCTARFSTKMGAVVMSPEQVTPIPLFKYGDYLGGATATVVAPGTIYNDMLESSQGTMHHYTYNPQDYANRHGDLFIIGTGCDAASFGDELPLGGYFRPANITSRLSEQDSANMLRQRYPSALFLNLLCGFDRIGNQQLGVPSAQDNFHLLTDLIAPMSETYAGRLCFQGAQNNYNPVTGQFDRVFSAGTGPLGPLAPNCGTVIKGEVGMTTYQESQRLVSTPLAIAY